MNFLSITHCSASKTFAPDFKVSDLNLVKTFDDTNLKWSFIVDNSNPRCLARDLYRGGGYKTLSSQLISETFYIISAGLGLINSNKKIPSYECTVSRGKPGSIVDYFKEDFDLKKWWNFLMSSKYSSGSISKNTKDADIILISVTADYLKMIADDLMNVKKQFYIFTGSKDLAIELGFENNLMPYNEVFDGPEGSLRGTNRDFSQRSHADFLRRLELYNNFDKAFCSVEHDMKTWIPPVKHNNTKKTDEEISSFIQIYKSKFRNEKELLRHFRYELKIACEEKRFKKLYKLFKESRHV